MKQDERLSVERTLQQVPAGHLLVRRRTAKGVSPLTDSLQIQTSGKGLVEIYSVFAGIEASYNSFLADEVAVQHAASPATTEIFYCQSGRVGWNMQHNISIYLGAGDMTVHSAVSCAHSATLSPMGSAQGLSLSLDWDQLSCHCPQTLLDAGLNPAELRYLFCTEQPGILPACSELSEIFAPLYRVQSSLRLPYLKLKVQELLLYLSQDSGHRKTASPSFSLQTELIREIHTLLTQHLDQRFTIEELSRRYAINTSTLKSVFKAVYGLPIATYMKEYRIRQAMNLLRQTDLTIAQIAERVGYESQGKFTNAFKDVAQILPSVYRKEASTVSPGSL